MEVGKGVYPPSYVEEILDARDRYAAGPKAAARGLTLISLDYEKEPEKEIRGENKEWSYTLSQEEIVSKKKACLTIHRCRQEDFERMLIRVVHQAVRNGAERVYVKDEEMSGRILLDKSYGFYNFRIDDENEEWLVTEK